MAGKRALIYSHAPQAAPAPSGQGAPLAPILGSVIPAAVLAALAALAAAWWWRRREEKRRVSAAPSSKARLPHDSDAILTPNSSGPFPVNMESVEEYLVKPADFKILRRKDGSDWLLGQGAFGKARPVLRPLPLSPLCHWNHLVLACQNVKVNTVGAAPAHAASSFACDQGMMMAPARMLPGSLCELDLHVGAHWLMRTAGRMQVYRGLLEHVQPVAIKVIPAGIVGATPRASAETLREITLLRQCRCPHIVQARPAQCSCM